MEAEQHVVRDLVQARLLGALFSKTLRSEIALKGGLAMRVLTSSARYTEDIDLAASPTIPKRTITGCVEKAVAELASSGLVSNLNLISKGQTDVTQKWMVHGTVGHHRIQLKIEISKRQHVASEDIVHSQYRPANGTGLAPVPISCVPLSSIAAGKFDCLQNSRREAPRDIYDLYILVGMDVRPSREVLRSYGRETLSRMRDLVWDKLEKMDYAQAKAQLLPYLPAGVAAGFDERAWDEMRYVVEEKVGEWIDDALAGDDADAPADTRGMTDERVAQTPA